MYHAIIAENTPFYQPDSFIEQTNILT